MGDGGSLAQGREQAVDMVSNSTLDCRTQERLPQDPLAAFFVQETHTQKHTHTLTHTHNQMTKHASTSTDRHKHPHPHVTDKAAEDRDPEGHLQVDKEGGLGLLTLHHTSVVKRRPFLPDVSHLSARQLASAPANPQSARPVLSHAESTRISHGHGRAHEIKQNI